MKVKIEFDTDKVAKDTDMTDLILVTMKKVVNFMNRYPKIGKSATNPMVDSRGVQVGSITIEK